MVTFCQYHSISRSYTLRTITKPLISLLFGIIGGGGGGVVVVAAGITIREALHVHHVVANVFYRRCVNYGRSQT